ncbi:MAG TPA: MFS transporter, partial [Nitrospiria bacterium]|nr:MFS transporter [Nitrospiria bacterium]
MSRYGSSFWFFCVIGFLAFVSYDLIRSPLLPLFADSLGASPWLIGLVVGVSTITGVFFKLPAGTLSDKIGRRPLLFSGLLVFAAGPPLYFLVEGVEMLFGLRIFHGFATAIFAPVALAVVADRFRENRGAALGWYTAFGQAGRLSGRTAGGFILGAWGFQVVFGIGAAMGMMALILFILTRFETGQASGESSGNREKIHVWTGMKEIAGEPRILAASGMEGVLLTASGSLMAFLPLYAVHSGLSAGQAGLLFGAMGVASIGARPLMGEFSDRLGRIPMILTGQLLCAGLMFTLPVLSGFNGLLFFSLAFGFSEAVMGSSTSALVADLSRKQSLG